MKKTISMSIDFHFKERKGKGNRENITYLNVEILTNWLAVIGRTVHFGNQSNRMTGKGIRQLVPVLTHGPTVCTPNSVNKAIK